MSSHFFDIPEGMNRRHFMSHLAGPRPLLPQPPHLQTRFWRMLPI